MRDFIHRIVGKAAHNDRLSRAYDIFIMVVAIVSLVPIMFKESAPWIEQLDLITVYILLFDYVLRWVVYDKISGRRSPWCFVLYPFTFFALVDFLSLLPSLGLVAASQAFRVLRALRVFKVLHYSKSFVYITNVFKKQRKVLLSILLIATGYIFISALVMFAYEPDTFNDFFHAVYWATTALTTVGYGDVYPTTDIGRFISMVSSVFGIAVIALPAGIITSGFMEELSRDAEQKKEELRAEIREEMEAERRAEESAREELMMHAAREGEREA